MRCNNVLIIEDQESIRETMQLALEMEGYKTVSASNGKEGLELLSKMSTPCLILLDLMMPEMNGWEFVQAVEKNTILAAIPVVVVTAFADQAQNLSTRAILKKPIDLTMLIDIVKQYCDPAN